jgi:hypothetical protein
MPQSAIVLHRLIGMLQQSVKFILPKCYDLLDPGEMRQAHLDLVRLPFPCVAFEIPWEKDGPVEAIGGIEQTAATKRIGKVDYAKFLLTQILGWLVSRAGYGLRYKLHV